MKPFRDSVDHLQAELDRVDVLLRRHLETWWAHNERSIEEYQGLYVSDETVDELLGAVRTGDTHPNGDRPSSDAELVARLERATEELRARERASRRRKRPLRLLALAEQFGLEETERDLLVLSLAPDLDQKYETIYAYLQDDVTRTRPTTDFLLRVVCDGDRERLTARTLFSSGSRLVGNRLVRLGPPDASRPAQVVTVAERVVDYLLGEESVAEALQSKATLRHPEVTVESLPLDPSVADRVASVATPRRVTAQAPMCYVHGPYGAGKQAVIEAVCAQAGTPVLVIDAQSLLTEDGEETLGLLRRELRLQEALLAVTGLTKVATESGALEALLTRVDAVEGRVFLAGEKPLPTRAPLVVTEHVFETLHVPMSSYELRVELWDRVEGLPPGADTAALAATFRFTGGQIHDAVASARRIAHGDGLTIEALYEGCRAQSTDTLDSHARKVPPHYTWDDIVLPADRMAHLREVAARIRHQGRVYSEWGFGEKYSLGRGLNVLFAGPSGTGKTMAAEIIANDAGLDLYKVDLSSVVSKYIGETEKNLGQIFDEAAETDAILFFDEADALFGKRSEVSDSHDRYANIEVNYLLQRVEEHDGTVILTTNFKQNIDDAFLRRLHLSVEFPRPDRESREAIWRLVFPAQTPMDDLDVEFLSTIELTGGNIKNVALTAAFLAAADDEAVGMRHVLRAIRREFQKTGKLFRPEEFGRYQTLLT